MKHLLLFCALVAVLNSCEIPVICCDNEPPTFGAIIRTSEDLDYLTANSDKTIVMYYDGETTHNGWDDVKPETFLAGDTTRLTALQVYSARVNGIQPFYLQVGDDIDTIHVEINKKKLKFTEVLFNGEPAKEANKSTGAYWLMIKT